MEKLIVKKRDGIVCWKVNTDGAYPNTVIELDRGLSLIIRVGTDSTVCSKSGVSIFSLLTLGKKSKLFGGKKPYDNCEIYAVDTSSDFQCEWALAGGKAMHCKDPEFDVEAKAIARGTFQHRIQDYFKFLSNFSFESRVDVTREDTREFFRNEVTNVASAYLAPKLMEKGVEGTQAHIGSYVEDLRYILNRRLAECGTTVLSLGIDAIEYEPGHMIHREELKRAKIGVTIKGVVNEGRRDDISVDKEASEIDIGLINAMNGNGGGKEKKPGGEAKAKILCTRCGEPNNAGANYCIRCGEKLGK